MSTISRYYAFVFFINLHLSASVLVPFFTDWGHISQSQIQLLQSWFMLWIFLLEIPTGVVADYLGRKFSLSLGAIATVCGLILYGSVPQFWAFLVGEFLLALGYALMSGADSALLYDALKESGQEERSKEVFGKAHSIKLGSFLIAALIGGPVAAKFGLNVPMLVTSIFCCIAAGIALTIKEPSIHEGPSESRRYIDILKSGFSYFYSHKKLRAVAIDATIVASATYFVLWLYQPMLQRLNVPIVFFGLFHASLAGIQILVAANFVRLERFFGSPTNFLRFSAAATAFAFILLALFPHMVTLVLFIMLAGGFGLTRIEYMLAYMNKLIPSAERATILSSIGMFRRLSLVLLNPFIGFIADASLRYALFAVGLLPLLLFFFKTPSEKAKN